MPSARAKKSPTPQPSKAKVPQAGAKRLLVTGASGLVGRAFVRLARERGYEVAGISRTAKEGDIVWSPSEGKLDPAALEGAHAVIHLAGENIIGRWNEGKKRAILESRRQGGDTLVKAIGACANPPKILISASAQGYYGSKREGELDETAGPGENFVAEVCLQWEGSVYPAKELGVRVACLRIGIVLDREGGALAKMLPAFRAGAGGPLGSGRQMMSWIDSHDLARAFLHAVETESLEGPVNAVAPEALSNRDFTRELAGALHRPAVLPVPPAALKLIYGQMAEEVLLSDLHLVPRKLLASGFAFDYPEIASALNHHLS